MEKETYTQIHCQSQSLFVSLFVCLSHSREGFGSLEGLSLWQAGTGIEGTIQETYSILKIPWNSPHKRLQLNQYHWLCAW